MKTPAMDARLILGLKRKHAERGNFERELQEAVSSHGLQEEPAQGGTPVKRGKPQLSVAAVLCLLQDVRKAGGELGDKCDLLEKQMKDICKELNDATTETKSFSFEVRDATVTNLRDTHSALKQNVTSFVNEKLAKSRVEDGVADLECCEFRKKRRSWKISRNSRESSSRTSSRLRRQQRRC